MRKFQQKPQARLYGAELEARNYICAYMKRDDPATRRFLQLLPMNRFCYLLVRDAETGQFLIKPPDDERWLSRGKNFRDGNTPIVRTVGEWDILEEIGPTFLKDIEKRKTWRFSFKGIMMSVFGIWE